MVPTLSQAFAYRREAPVPSSPLWPSTGLSPLCPCLSCTGGPKYTPCVASPVLRRGEGSCPSACLGRYPSGLSSRLQHTAAQLQHTAGGLPVQPECGQLPTCPEVEHQPWFQQEGNHIKYQTNKVKGITEASRKRCKLWTESSSLAIKSLMQVHY